MVNECLMHLRKNKTFHLSIETDAVDVPYQDFGMLQLQAQDIYKLLDDLPTGYRTVFNLYVLEGYKHREIAEMMGISINTSKSQLILARKKLQDMLKKIDYPNSRTK